MSSQVAWYLCGDEHLADPEGLPPPTVEGFFFLTQRYILNGSQYYPTTLFP